MALSASGKEFIKRFDRYNKEHSTLKDASYYALRDSIILNTFQDEITEAQIASLLNISRTPIREAMLQLSQDGLLEVNRGRKAKIIHLTAQDFSDITVILDNLHTLSVALCVEHADEDDIRRIEETVALIEFCTNRKDLKKLPKYNAQFHLQIALGSKNKWLSDIMERLLSYSAIYREYAVSRPGRMKIACKEHIAIYKAIAARDKEKALDLIHKHVEKAFSISTPE